MELEEASSLLRRLRDFIAGIKVGLPALLHLGLRALELPKVDPDLLYIFDGKLADVGHIEAIVAQRVFDAGFDALIFHPFVGFEGAATELAKRKGNRGLLAVCSMSHPGSAEFLNLHTQELMRKSWEAGVDGFILPAQKPELISRARSEYPEVLILSPGVGAQGAEPGSAVAVGADFEIVGRRILLSEEPEKEAERIWHALKEVKP